MRCGCRGVGGVCFGFMHGFNVTMRRDLWWSTCTQIPTFKRSENTMTIDVSTHGLLIRNNTFFEFFDYDRGKSDQKVMMLAVAGAIASRS